MTIRRHIDISVSPLLLWDLVFFAIEPQQINYTYTSSFPDILFTARNSWVKYNYKKVYSWKVRTDLHLTQGRIV